MVGLCRPLMARASSTAKLLTQTGSCDMVRRTAMLRRRVLVLLLLLYCSLDFANPLMPGAVSFGEGSVDGIRAEHWKSTDSRAALVAPPGHDSLNRPPDVRGDPVLPPRLGHLHPPWSSLLPR